MSSPLITVYTVVHGDIYQRYADQLCADCREHFPAGTQVLQLPGRPGWPATSAKRYETALEHWDFLEGEWIFQLDADMRVLQPIEVASDICRFSGLTVTTHPGFPPGGDPATWPYDRNPRSVAYVQPGDGRQYHPGAFVGGPRDDFWRLAEWIAGADNADRAMELPAPRWYDEAYLNRYLIDHPPALVLDKRYCWWQYWGVSPEAVIMHLDKTPEEFAWSDAQ